MVVVLAAQNKPPASAPTSAPATQEQEPPEEDPDLQPKEYSFNPLEASRNITAGDFYFKKGNFRAASARYLEASKWDAMSSEALLKLGQSYEKLRSFGKAREAYEKYLTVAADSKDSESLKRRMSKLPKSHDPK